MDFATLKACKPHQFEEAADGYHKTHSMASQAREALERQITPPMRRKLKGEAAKKALNQLSELLADFQYVEVECGLMTGALNALAFDLRAVKKKLDAAIEDAEAEKLTVNADGSVSYPPGGDKGGNGKVPEGGKVIGRAKGAETGAPIDPAKDADDAADGLERQIANLNPNPNYGRAVQYANRIAQIVKEATGVDQRWARKLREYKADDDLVVSDSDWIDVKKDTSSARSGAKHYLDHIKHPPKGGSPDDIAKWWKGLSQDERDAYIALDAKKVGALDGLPAVVRDEANRTVLAEAHAEASQKLREFDESRPEPKKYEPKWDNQRQVPIDGEVQITLAWKAWDKERSELRKKLDPLEAIQGRFDQTGQGGLPEAYLLGFDAEGKGRAIVANGNPDTADHTAVYVPGTYSKLSGVEGDINRMTDLWRRSQREVPGQSVSTITWIGYDAPQSIVPEAMDESYAWDAAPTLNKFLDGLQAAQGGPEASHTTVIGHSYGSTVIGAASIKGHLAADDIVVAGSPGVLVEHADDLDTGKDHVWSQAAPFHKDQVPLGGKVAGLGRGDTFLEDLLPFGAVWGQNVPSDEDFGAHRMQTDAQSHTDYFRDGSVSQSNQAFVVTGKYDRVSHD
ncbi:alpha/beta hydrolase [Streptomyces palmae]|uniref:DUF1023 domain-containing protein n=1 Tax=Streptomyces palmae TaxID=1701085 RepID=A0A4Z0GMS9_9ACTN|nr:alpha/beta hydrolase [Streptomyces palmae]TGA97463.1 hypothetical protein E4099_23515 [Streptomyces palmae]